MITRDSIETAYCFFHQKQQVYAHSGMEWQKDDIRQAIADYAGQMNPALYQDLAGGKEDFLMTPGRFEDDLRDAVASLTEKINAT